MSQKNVAVCWLVTCLSNKTGFCSGSSPLLMWSQTLCQPHIQIKGWFLLLICLSNLLVPLWNSVGSLTKTVFLQTQSVNLCKYIYIKIESIRMLDCPMFSIFNKRVFSVFKTLWPSVLKTAGGFAKQFQVMLMAKYPRRLLKSSLTPCTTCPPAAQCCFILPREESSCKDRDSPLQGPSCICCERICSSGSAVKEQN